MENVVSTWKDSGAPPSTPPPLVSEMAHPAPLKSEENPIAVKYEFRAVPGFRRASISQPARLTQLREKMALSYPVWSAVFLNHSLQLQICFKDDEGDTIYITNDAELEEAIRFAHHQGKVFRFFVPKEVVMPRTALTSPNIEGLSLSENAPSQGQGLEQIWHFSNSDFRDMLATRIQAMVAKRNRRQKKVERRFDTFVNHMRFKLDRVSEVSDSIDSEAVKVALAAEENGFEAPVSFGESESSEWDDSSSDSSSSEEELKAQRLDTRVVRSDSISDSSSSEEELKTEEGLKKEAVEAAQARQAQRSKALAARYGNSVLQFDPRVQAYLADCLMADIVPDMVPPPPPMPAIPPQCLPHHQRERHLDLIVKAAAAFRRNEVKPNKPEKKKNKAIKKAKTKAKKRLRKVKAKAKKVLGKALQKAKKKLKKANKQMKEKGAKLQKKLKQKVQKARKAKKAQKEKKSKKKQKKKILQETNEKQQQQQQQAAAPAAHSTSLFDTEEEDDDLFCLNDAGQHMELVLSPRKPSKRGTTNGTPKVAAEKSPKHRKNRSIDSFFADDTDYSMDWCSSDDDSFF